MNLNLVITGPVKCGKTTELMQMYKADTGSKLFVKLCTKGNNRKELITTHDEKFTVEGLLIKSIEGYYEADSIYLDEFQFGEFYYTNYFKCKNLYIAGLDMDSLQNPFKSVGLAMCLAKEVKKKRAICDICKRPARFSRSKRIVTSFVEDDGNESIFYPVCDDCKI